jgi:hypothetical protein
MATITVTHEGGPSYYVVVDEGGSTTRHQVTVRPSDVERYAPGSTPAALVEASFEFLLEREPKESILRRFEITVIERYFREYPATIRTMLGDRGRS